MEANTRISVQYWAASIKLIWKADVLNSKHDCPYHLLASIKVVSHFFAVHDVGILATQGRLTMSRETWYVLVPKGSTEFSGNMMGLIEIPASKTVFHLKRSVLEKDGTILPGIQTALALEVCEFGSDIILASNKVLSECISGSSESPFFIRYPGSTWFILFACVTTFMHAHSVLIFFLYHGGSLLKLYLYFSFSYVTMFTHPPLKFHAPSDSTQCLNISSLFISIYILAKLQ